MSEKLVPRLNPSNIAMFAAFGLLHLACFAAFFTGVHAVDVAICLGLFWLRMFGITAGYHRYFAHRAFKTGRVFQFILGFIAQSSLQSGLIWWASKHRDHHKFVDTPKDVHSPREYGFWFAHMGWIFDERAQQPNLGNVPDITRYPELVWLDKYHWLPGVLMGAAVGLAAGWSGFVVGFCLSTVLLWHSTFFINSLAHVYGKQRYLTGDDSRNNWWLALLTLGEGWHNNHHYYMASVRQGFYWWEIDVTYYLLKLLQLFGLVHDLKEPPAHIRDGQRKISPEIRERIALRLAQTFPVDAMAQQFKARWEEESTRSRVAWDDFKARLQHAVDGALEEGRESFDHLNFPELPSLDEIRKKADHMFARSHAMDDIIMRARLQMAQAMTVNLRHMEAA
ncbi:MAG: acyl-CoA desaturase [Oceanococcus sp.]